MTEVHTPVILVTGGCGYLGSQLIRDLAQDEYGDAVTIRVLDNMQGGHYRSLMDLPAEGNYELIEGDILDPAAVRQALQGVDAVIHLAAVVSTPMGYSNPIWMEQVNHWGTARLTEACLAAGVKRFIFASSAAVYGPGGPFQEDARCQPVGPYAQSKRRAEMTVEIAGQRGLLTTILRLGTLFGDAPVIRFEAVANRFAYLAGMGRSLTIYGSGKQKRPLVHVRDASSAMRFCLANSQATAGRILNVVGENASILDLVEAVRYSRPEVAVRYTDQDVLTHFSFEADGSALGGSGPGWRPMLTIEAGMAELLAKFPSVIRSTPGLSFLDLEAG